MKPTPESAAAKDNKVVESQPTKPTVPVQRQKALELVKKEDLGNLEEKKLNKVLPV